MQLVTCDGSSVSESVCRKQKKNIKREGVRSKDNTKMSHLFVLFFPTLLWVSRERHFGNSGTEQQEGFHSLHFSICPTLCSECLTSNRWRCCWLAGSLPNAKTRMGRVFLGFLRYLHVARTLPALIFPFVSIALWILSRAAIRVTFGNVTGLPKGQRFSTVKELREREGPHQFQIDQIVAESWGFCF